MNGVADEIKRVRNEIVDIASRLAVVTNTRMRLTTEIGQLQESQERLEVWLVTLECQQTEAPVDSRP